MFIKAISDYTIIGACVLREDNIAAIFRKNIEAEDLDFSVMYFDGSMFHELPLDNDYYIGIVNCGDDVFVLGKSGNITRYSLSSNMTLNDILSSREDWSIEDSKDYCDLVRIRVLGADVLCCGQFSQLYLLESDLWKRYDHGLRSYDSPDFQDIGGSGVKEIYGVGLDGEVRMFNGINWRKIDIPTNQHILCIGSYSADEYFLAGYNGLILKGRDDLWEVKGEMEDDKRYWDCARHYDRMYFVHSKGIDCLDGDELEHLDIQIPGEKLTFHRLFSGENYLWSIGEQHILMFDGRAWKEFTMM
ncbi:MAG: hypothetical protein KZQ76_07570 [Candidatus Thiodiazotropha sp. (ex Epidulcina cf. delphinae)]|nr:hypothetical protein [Candidatus Thiodiazotropha sp. (ex Epidulcina cf. delphinae)]